MMGEKGRRGGRKKTKKALSNNAKCEADIFVSYMLTSQEFCIVGMVT